MDPITHTMAGAAIAGAGWRRRTALAAPVAMLAANAPDIDILSYVHGEYAGLALRRGWTHGPLALVLLAVVIPLLALGWDRAVRRRRDPAAAPARAGPLVLLGAVAAVSHPLLDWMNTYGVRWLMPFDSRWYYGDSLFIIDPWLWLAFGVPLFLLYSARPAAVAAWTLAAAAATALVLTADAVPAGARGVWLAALVTAALVRFRRPAAVFRDRAPALALAGLAVAALYIAAMVAADRAARDIAAAHAEAAGIAAERIMVAPRPADPLRGDVVIATADAYHFGRFDWGEAPRVVLDGGTLAAGSLDGEVERAAAAVPDARDFLRWSRFPIVRVESDGDGHIVHFGDARYAAGRRMGALAGLSIRLDARLQPR